MRAVDTDTAGAGAYRHGCESGIADAEFLAVDSDIVRRARLALGVDGRDNIVVAFAGTGAFVGEFIFLYRLIVELHAVAVHIIAHKVEVGVAAGMYVTSSIDRR